MINVMPYLDQLPIIILITLVVVLFALFIYQLLINLQIKKRPEKILNDAQNKSYDLLSEAIKKAENIIAIAELQGLKIATSDKLSTKDTRDKFTKSLEEVTQRSVNSLSEFAATSQQSIIKSESDFKTYLDSLSKQASQSTTHAETQIEQKVNSLFEAFEQNLSNFLTQSQSQSVKAIDLEMQAARQLIQTYKQQQFKLIDENIVAMLEQTLSLVLAKKMSLKEQMDLVYESLEKAKAEKFII